MFVEINKMSLEDFENIKNILQSDFDDFWSVSTLKDELIASNSYYLVAKLENEIVGFAGVKIVLDEADIMNIVVKKSKRNQGIGSLLLKNLILLTKEHSCKKLSLEVNEENLPAIKLYEKFGFKQLGIRKNYYNDKNGIIMTKE